MRLALALLLLGAASAARQLRALALVDTENDEHQLAAVAEVDAASGAVRNVNKSFDWSVQWATSLDCATTWAPSPSPRWLSLVGEGPSVAVVDALTGALVSVSPPLDVAYVIATVEWDARAGNLVAIGQASGSRSIDLIRINATSGAVTVELHGVAGAPFPLPCDAVLSLATRTFYAVNSDVQNDDADQTVEAYSLDTGLLLHSVPWPAHSQGIGPVGGPVVVTASADGGADTLVLLWADPDGSRPLRLITLDLASGANVTLTELPAGSSGTVVDIGGVSPAPVRAAADGSFSLVAMAFDNPQDVTMLLEVGVAAGAGPGSGNASLTGLAAGGSMLWAPVYVDV